MFDPFLIRLTQFEKAGTKDEVSFAGKSDN